MKVLWVGDAIIQSGFSVVTHNICSELINKCDVAVFGIGYDGFKKNPYPYHIYPANTGIDLYSFNLLAKVLVEEDPDVIVLFNDDNIISKYLDVIGSTDMVVPMFPINMLPLNKKLLSAFTTGEITDVITYTEFAKKEINKINPNLSVTPAYHGVHSSVFSPSPITKKMMGLNGKFIVGNVNSNTYRKRLDLFLEGFSKFAKGKHDVMCLIHATNRDIAYDLNMITRDLKLEDKVILSFKPVDFDALVSIYNLMDVNVNTSIGEGFGLSLLEGAACGVPVVCPEHGNLKDIWTQGAEFISIDRHEYVPGTSLVGDIISTDSLAEVLDRLYSRRDYLKKLSEEALLLSKYSKFQWSTVADKVYKAIKSTKNKKISYIS